MLEIEAQSSQPENWQEAVRSQMARCLSCALELRVGAFSGGAVEYRTRRVARRVKHGTARVVGVVNCVASACAFLQQPRKAQADATAMVAAVFVKNQLRTLKNMSLIDTIMTMHWLAVRMLKPQLMGYEQPQTATIIPAERFSSTRNSCYRNAYQPSGAL